MKIKIVGIQNVDYKSKKTGKDVKGHNLYCVYDEASPSLVGQKTESFWLRNDLQVDSFKPGDNVNVYFDRFGHIESIGK